MATSPGESMVTLDPDLLRNKKVLEIECMRGGGARYLAEVAGPECYVATDEREENIEICHAVHDVFPAFPISRWSFLIFLAPLKRTALMPCCV